MNVNFTQTITDLDGQPIPESETAALTLRSVAVNALLTTFPMPNGQPEMQSGDMKVRLAALAQDIHRNPAEVALTIEDAALLKERIGRAYAPLVVMRAWHMLEAASQTSE